MVAAWCLPVAPCSASFAKQVGWEVVEARGISYDDAMRSCVAKNKRLAYINSAEEQSAIEAQLATKNWPERTGSRYSAAWFAAKRCGGEGPGPYDGVGYIRTDGWWNMPYKKWSPNGVVPGENYFTRIP